MTNIYYHFLSSPNAINDLEEKRIKISQIDELNDPFELMPYLGETNAIQRNRYRRLRRMTARKFGILCFSKNWSDPLLWGHYADKHKGIALGFKIEGYGLIPVHYLSRMPILTINALRNEKDLINRLIKFKYEEWSYENEMRIVVDLSDCIPIREQYFLPFRENLVLSEIIFGAKYDNSTEHIVELLKETKAKLIQSRTAFKSYRIIQNHSVKF